jgi:hypothetical protein
LELDKEEVQGSAPQRVSDKAALPDLLSLNQNSPQEISGYSPVWGDKINIVALSNLMIKMARTTMENCQSVKKFLQEHNYSSRILNMLFRPLDKLLVMYWFY